MVSEVSDVAPAENPKHASPDVRENPRRLLLELAASEFTHAELD